MANLNSGNWKRFTPDKENLFVPGACLLHFERNITPCVNKYTALPEFFFPETCTNYFSFCRDLQIRYEYYIRKIKVKNSNTIPPLNLSVSTLQTFMSCLMWTLDVFVFLRNRSSDYKYRMILKSNASKNLNKYLRYKDRFIWLLILCNGMQGPLLMCSSNNKFYCSF